MIAPKRTPITRGLRFASRAVTDPAGAWRRLSERLGYAPVEDIDVGSLLPRQTSGGPKVVHVANFNDQNAGDMLLTTTLRDLFLDRCGPIRWTGLHAHDGLGPARLRQVNRARGLIVGGGGLFLRDTNPNPQSGWQWSSSLDDLRRIKVPLVLFAVGYNRFRGQPEFDPIFREHLTATAEKSLFLGLRNSGSIRAVRNYLPEELHAKIRYQPCMTTLMSRFYPQLMPAAEAEPPFVALNCAFDRSALRYGDCQEQILAEIAEAMWRISRRVAVKFYAHNDQDERILPALVRRGVPFELVRLYGTSPGRMVEAYAAPALSIGMRGHAQMIPFGCRRPILSLISHDKLRWFLEDIEAEDWGVEVDEPDLADRLASAALEQLDRPAENVARIDAAQDRLWEATTRNLDDIARAFDLRPAPAVPAAAVG